MYVIKNKRFTILSSANQHLDFNYGAEVGFHGATAIVTAG